MPRSVGKVRSITCSTCSTAVKVTWWYAGDEFSQAPEWNEANIKSAVCSCSEPQWTFPSSNATAHVSGLGTKKTVVYVMPDGDYIAPHSNDIHDEQAKLAREWGGVRRELGSIRELDAFQREQRNRQRDIWQREIDEGIYEGTSLDPSYQQLEAALYEKARNQVLEYDEKSLLEGRDRIRERMAEDRQRQVETQQRRRASLEKPGFRLGRPSDRERYERLKSRR